MAKFLKYILLHILTILFIMYILDRLYTYIYINGTPRNKVSNLMSLKNETIDFVFIGSSRVDNNIDADIIETVTGQKAINLGVQGGEISDYFLLLQLLKEQQIKTKMIFIQVDYVFNSKEESPILQSSLMPYINNQKISNHLNNTGENVYLLKYVPFYRYLKFDYKIGFREMFNTLIGNQPRINLQNGYFAKYGTISHLLQASLPVSIVEENDGINAINDYAKENEMNIIYFIAPVCAATKNLDFVQKLERKLPSFIDFSTEFKNDSLFFDCIHLNYEGAKEFSRILGEKIISDIRK